MNYKDILNDQNIISEYNKIDSINTLPLNHGLNHIINVTNIMDKLTDVIGISGEEKNDLLITTVLHDIGQVDGRQNHGLKAKIFTQKYLNGKISDARLENIMSAIEFHSQKDNLDSLPLFTNLVVFADKMDFTYKRLDDNWENKIKSEHKQFGDIYKNVIDVDFSVSNSQFIVGIKTTDEISIDNMLCELDFFSKVINSTNALAKKLGLYSLIKINGVTINCQSEKLAL